ncbi:2,3-bisphosphoglycerate-independent phosphoglycerate mutase [Fusobacterium sp. DD29]|uniref:2,3-bisphosphoglycerate-independent phosphoglycerate mutase n=1 Tax=unclassified Fusobacterium TaxID=2648384 RepID=UPI001B8B92E6|nr:MULTISPECIES: 2,3-bisphosphoglycerate-independent phosphoglycerate mutase [unclassified Fusobacterium]MBR8700174.1 2,3-bisphosphoglycerate-independent phosphoglycerate mutase [Fusobacterium sp. DD45]MBR8710375.1 2,3-bisphosphoglycerate-independent phosphoglycerate mutase [Fusobacterium sp. DD28]MBR8748763.1 2,3-bisphosphoglycerate-independent phosphoglycerate mutase [Fusobacterium sp. DD29]MBR8750896.1 2,3-bisphosphoglycerate-independent phosphoglycerate mutase [Fusobacterium sp. DD26]MBR87
MKKPLMLMILDGWGINTHPEQKNAITTANPETFNRLLKEYPHSQLEASGEAVGLPDGQMGNSEVGHLNIGSGRIIYQPLVEISKDIKDGTIYENPVLKEAFEAAVKGTGRVHFGGLVSNGGVHSHIDHLFGLLAMAKKYGVKAYVHAFLDGRDTPPKSGEGFLKELEAEMKKIGEGKIATISGRYYAMDRDKNWDRIKLAYDAIVLGEGKKASSATEAIENSYAENVTDEFVIPTVIDAEGLAKPGDVFINFNFRPDRAREITRALNDKDFTGFERKYPEIKYYCMRQYDATIDAPVIYADKEIKNTLGEVLSKAGMKQLRTAETEKYAHVTFFFNGGVEVPFPGEDRKLVASPKVATYDLQPEMSACGVTEGLMEALNSDQYDVIIINYANPDMVGHTGVFEAAVAAVKKIDRCIATVSKKVLDLGGTLLITADHGNVELMEDPVTHAPFTAHTTNKVPFILVSEKYKNAKLDDGKLSDIAPTMLDILGIAKPAEMTGKSLIEK